MGFLILFTPATRFPQPSSSRRLRRHPDNIRGRLRRNRKPLHGVRRPHQLAVTLTEIIFPNFRVAPK